MLVLEIHNDKTGTPAIGNYDWTLLVNTDVIARGRVERFRRDRGAAKLLARVSAQLLRQHETGSLSVADILMSIFDMKRVTKDTACNI